MSDVEKMHADMVFKLGKTGRDIMKDMSPEKAHDVHMAIGISGEAGELLDAVKKSVIYNKPLDLANVVEELGDMEFYMEGLRRRLGITREETLFHNMQKLSKRYPNYEYTDGRAQERADKNV